MTGARGKDAGGSRKLAAKRRGSCPPGQLELPTIGELVPRRVPGSPLRIKGLAADVPTQPDCGGEPDSGADPAKAGS
ncbi:MAG: hypothetical protein PHT60_14835 [Acidiphilium sp.]|nr:hypothetical protein [Acidiphilium sp.]MDD4937037.1 hypothetical protein [Acidiphilium sp.]